AAGALLMWLANGVVLSPPLDALSYASLVGATAVAGLQALAIGILLGSFLRPIAAPVLAVVASGALLAAGLLVSPEPPRVPTAGLGLLAQTTDLLRPLAEGLQALGIGLTLTGLL